MRKTFFFLLSHLAVFISGVLTTFFFIDCHSHVPPADPTLRAADQARILMTGDVSDTNSVAYTVDPSDQKTISFLPSSISLIEKNTSDNFSNPIPQEWEAPFFGVLQQTNLSLRNQGLIQLAVNTAARVPRIQAECLRHLTYSLSENDYPLFLFLIRHPALPTEIKASFFAETLNLHKESFAHWLANSFANDRNPRISAVARNYLEGVFLSATEMDSPPPKKEDEDVSFPQANP